MRLATWNVNSIKARLPSVLQWLEEAEPDVVCLQETKTTDDAFPRLEFESAGWHVETHGQKTYNGVAILSRAPMTDISRGLPGDEADDHARYMEATIEGVRVCCLYLPNGNPVDGPKFPYKLAWMRRMIDRAKGLLDEDLPFVLAGDYNVIPQDADVWDPKAFEGDALTRPESRALFRELTYLGLTDAVRALNPGPGVYTYWDYQGGAWAKNFGLRIDHLMLSPKAADALRSAGVDKRPRGREKASDHTPAWVELAF